MHDSIQIRFTKHTFDKKATWWRCSRFSWLDLFDFLKFVNYYYWCLSQTDSFGDQKTSLKIWNSTYFSILIFSFIKKNLIEIHGKRYTQWHIVTNWKSTKETLQQSISRISQMMRKWIKRLQINIPDSPHNRQVSYVF